MSETFGKDIMESVKDAIGTDIEDFIDPASIKKDLGDEMKKDLDLELKAIDEDKEMNSLEKNFKKAFLKLKNSVLGGIFGWDKESAEDEETAEPTKIESYKNVINDPALLALASGPDINYMADQTFQMYLLNLEEKYGLPYKTLKCLMGQESTGKLYKNGKIITSSAKAQWLFQFIPDTADMYMKELNFTWTREEFYKNPVISAEACALYLQKSLKKGADIGTTLAQYNAGPGVLDSKNIDANNFSKLPKETQKYILYIGSNILKEMGVGSPIAFKDIDKPHKIKKVELEAFLAALNKTPLTKDHIKHKEISPTNTDILANNMSEVSGFGASLLDGLKGSGLNNVQGFSGKSSKELLEELNQPSILQTVQNGESCILFEWYNDITKKTDFKENVSKIIEKIKPTQPILCTLYYNTYAATPNTEVDKINKAIRELAIEKNLPLIDIQKDNVVWVNDLASDGLHLTTTGYKKVYDKIKQTVEKQTIA